MLPIARQPPAHGRAGARDFITERPLYLDLARQVRFVTDFDATLTSQFGFWRRGMAMKYTRPILAALALSVTLGSYLALAQQQQPAGQGRGGQAAPPQPMSFFITSTAKGDGANLGGIAGADAHCQALAKAAGRGDVKWVAYLS